MVTIKDLAKLADVSPTTVSNVLHGRTSKISPAKLRKVEKIIKETSYVPNMGGRLLAKHGSRIIGVIMFYEHRKEMNISQDPFHGELIGALEASIREQGYFMLLYTVKNYEESQRVISGWNIEGLIVLGCAEADVYDFLDKLSIPVVFIDSYLEKADSRFYNIGLDDYGGGRLMGDYLQTQGLRRIAFLADAENPVGVDLERLRGLQSSSAMISFIPLDYQDSIRHKMLKKLVKTGEIKNYDVFFFASDLYAVDSMNLFFELGLDIPSDISIAGFDNNLLSQESRPKLTTIKQSVSAKGAHAVEMLISLINGDEPENKRLVLPVELIVRGSIQIRDPKDL